LTDLVKPTIVNGQSTKWRRQVCTVIADLFGEFGHQNVIGKSKD